MLWTWRADGASFRHISDFRRLVPTFGLGIAALSFNGSRYCGASGAGAASCCIRFFFLDCCMAFCILGRFAIRCGRLRVHGLFLAVSFAVAGVAFQAARLPPGLCVVVKNKTHGRNMTVQHSSSIH